MIAPFLPLLFLAQAPPEAPRVDAIFAAFNTHTPGCAVGVARNGTVVFRAGYGMADLERNVPISSNTVFESGSVAKQFTAATLLLLAQQGRLSLDDPMRKYLPELADYGAPVTIRQVLSHTSGLREWRPVATFGGREEGTFVYTNQDLLQLAAQQRALNFDPGSAYSYTNTGFNIATILVERVTGKSFPQFTHEMIFAPLGMTHTRWREDFRKITPNRALAYGMGADGELTQQTPIENIIGAGGLLTTVDDLLKWNENFTHARVGGPELVKAQQIPATLTNGQKINYAAGLTVASYEGTLEVAHSGATGGYRTWLARYPEHTVSVAVLCNSAQSNPTALGRETARLWTGTKPAPAVAGPAVELSKFTGPYRRLRDNTVTHVRAVDGKLIFGSTPLSSAAANQFVSASGVAYHFGDRLRVVAPTGEVLYERVEPASPQAAELAAFAGIYESRETRSALTFSVDPGGLRYAIGVQKGHLLKPTFRDTFENESGAAFHFVRDTAGKVTAVSIGEDRVWDLRFERRATLTSGTK